MDAKLRKSKCRWLPWPGGCYKSFQGSTSVLGEKGTAVLASQDLLFRTLKSLQLKWPLSSSLVLNLQQRELIPTSNRIGCGYSWNNRQKRKNSSFAFQLSWGKKREGSTALQKVSKSSQDTVLCPEFFMQMQLGKVSSTAAYATHCDAGRSEKATNTFLGKCSFLRDIVYRQALPWFSLGAALFLGFSFIF